LFSKHLVARPLITSYTFTSNANGANFGFVPMGWWPFGGSVQTEVPLSAAGEQLAQQIEVMDAVFKVAIAECGRKCVFAAAAASAGNYREAELSKGEAVCVKRCAAKLFEVLDVVGAQLAAMNSNGAMPGL
jgi:Tim10/DDP family zinc finger